MALVTLAHGFHGVAPAVAAGRTASVPGRSLAHGSAGDRCALGATDVALVRRAGATALGRPAGGRLTGGVPLPDDDAAYLTWDSADRTVPSRGWRRWGTELLVRTTVCVAASYRAAHPDAARVLIGDLSRPEGGPFGAAFGGPGHASHQNGLDVDVYYPRLDGREIAPLAAGEVDRALAQELVDRFVAAGAVRVFVGPHVGLVGPAGVVQVAAHHDNHLHARFAARGTPGADGVGADPSGDAADPDPGVDDGASLPGDVPAIARGTAPAGRAALTVRVETTPPRPDPLKPTS